MHWRWTARRLVISTFLLAHMSAILIWVLPNCPIKQRVAGGLSYYILPLGLWQYWGMFAPDPVRDSITLEAEVVDSRGLRYVFAFTRLGDYSWWAGIPRFRHSKYTANMISDELTKAREFSARHAVRKLGLPADSYPVEVNMIYQVRRTPPPGDPPPDAMTPTSPLVIGTYHFASLSEVRP